MENNRTTPAYNVHKMIICRDCKRSFELNYDFVTHKCDPRLVPRYTEPSTMQAALNDIFDREAHKNFSIDNLQVSQDYRIIARRLLEHCLETFEVIINCYYLHGCHNNNKDDVTFAIAQLKAALAIEKPVLKSQAICGSYHSLILNGDCQNCGNSKYMHK